MDSPMKKQTIKQISVTILILAIIGLLLPKLPMFQTSASNAQSSGQNQQPVQVRATVIHPKVLRDKVVTSGNILANESIDVKSEISGKIMALHFKEGAPVKKNHLLIKMNDAELQAQLLQVQQSRSLAEEKNYRQKQLLKKQAVSQEEYDQSLNDLNNLKAQEQLIQARIAKTEIRAPFSGIIGLRYVSLGDYISPSTRITTFQDINPVKIDFSVPEKYAQRVKSGDKIHFTTGDKDTVYEGTVYAVEPRIAEDTRTLQVRAIASNDSKALMPGAFAEVELILNEIDNAVMIPTESLIPESQTQKVYLQQHGKALSRDVKTGIRTEDKIQITEGISAGDTVITAGILNLRPGAPIEITQLSE